jgi:hypothetical protein
MFLLTAGTLVGAEMAKEGSGPNATYFTSTSQVLAQGKENYSAINCVQKFKALSKFCDLLRKCKLISRKDIS